MPVARSSYRLTKPACAFSNADGMKNIMEDVYGEASKY